MDIIGNLHDSGDVSTRATSGDSLTMSVSFGTIRFAISSAMASMVEKLNKNDCAIAILNCSVIRSVNSPTKSESIPCS